MSGNDDKSQAAADRIKAQALSNAKGLSRHQAERAAEAAARNVNAYGQKEEGPSRWQERKEAKRQMYLMSTEKAVKLGVKPNAAPASSAGGYTQCQKCFQPGHWTYECKNERVYMSRPSRTEQLKNPRLKKAWLPASSQFMNPDLEVEEEEERKLMKEQLKKKSGRKEGKSKRKHHARSDSDNSSYDSDTEASLTDSEYSSDSGSSSCSSSDSEYKKRQHKRKQKKRRHRRDSTSSASSESESASDSDSDDKGSRRKSRKQGSRR